MNLMAKIQVVLISVLIFQAVAVLAYCIFEEGFFVQLFAVSIVFSVIVISKRAKKI